MLTKLLYPKTEYWNKRNSFNQSPKPNLSFLEDQIPMNETKVGNLDEAHSQ